jgi:OMF family outer membrane factor
MKLVNIHILTLLFLLLGVTVQAQVWSLNQCIDAARNHNKNLKINQNNALIGEQKHKEAVANLIPKVNVNADYKYFTNLPYQLLPLSTFNPTAPEGQFKEAQFGVPHNINATGQVALPIYNPQIYGAIQTTKIATELTKLQYQKAEETLFFDISNLYYNAQILKNQLVFIDSNLVNTQKLLSNMQLLRGQAMAKGTDVGKVELQAEQLNTQRLNVQTKYEQALNALKFAMGLTLDKPLDIEPKIEPNTEGGYNNAHFYFRSCLNFPF